MSELKAYYVPTRSGNSCHCYIKDEADKVIAELKAQKAQAEDDCAYWKTMSRKCADDNEVMAKQRAEAFRRESHHKYKRCLAMASYWVAVSYQCVDDKHRQSADRHRRKWLELANKFKDKEAK